MKDLTSHHRQVFYLAQSTYIQVSNHAIRNQKPIQKGTKIPKAKKNYTKKGKIFTKTCAKGFTTSPL